MRLQTALGTPLVAGVQSRSVTHGDGGWQMRSMHEKPLIQSPEPLQYEPRTPRHVPAASKHSADGRQSPDDLQPPVTPVETLHVPAKHVRPLPHGLVAQESPIAPSLVDEDELRVRKSQIITPTRIT